MNEAEYAQYLEVMVRDYAQENVEAGYWDPADAEDRARKQNHGITA